MSAVTPFSRVGQNQVSASSGEPIASTCCLHFPCLESAVRAADFEYNLPENLIAQEPLPEREHSRLLGLDRTTGQWCHGAFLDFPNHLKRGDVLVLNDSAVVPARLRGVNEQTGGQFELLLLEQNQTNDWWAMMRPGKRARVDTKIRLATRTGGPSSVSATVMEVNHEGHRRLTFSGTADILNELPSLGEVPLPPYIKRARGKTTEADRARYQTVYAENAGSVAAPTAGLHFTPGVLSVLRERGIEIAPLTLHVGPGTFAPVKNDDLAEHVMHEEQFRICPQTADVVTRARAEDRRIIAVGTTSLRVLESAACSGGGEIRAGSGRTRLFVYPPYTFQVVSGLLTNFHLPRSTLLMLVSAFAAPGETRGRELILACYAAAIRERYRFFSYGDAMFIS